MSLQANSRKSLNIEKYIYKLLKSNVYIYTLYVRHVFPGFSRETKPITNRQSHACSLNTLSATREWALGLEHFLLKKIKSPQQPVLDLSLIFSCFRLSMYIFVLLKHVSYGTWPSPPLYLSSVVRKQGLSAAVQRGYCQEGPTGHGELMPIT